MWEIETKSLMLIKTDLWLQCFVYNLKLAHATRLKIRVYKVKSIVASAKKEALWNHHISKSPKETESLWFSCARCLFCILKIEQIKWNTQMPFGGVRKSFANYKRFIQEKKQIIHSRNSIDLLWFDRVSNSREMSMNRQIDEWEKRHQIKIWNWLEWFFFYFYIWYAILR